VRSICIDIPIGKAVIKTGQGWDYEQIKNTAKPGNKNQLGYFFICKDEAITFPRGLL